MPSLNLHVVFLSIDHYCCHVNESDENQVKHGFIVLCFTCLRSHVERVIVNLGWQTNMDHLKYVRYVQIHTKCHSCKNGFLSDCLPLQNNLKYPPLLPLCFHWCRFLQFQILSVQQTCICTQQPHKYSLVRNCSTTKKYIQEVQ